MPGHARRHSAVRGAEIAEPIEMRFGLWIRVGLRNHHPPLEGATLREEGDPL